MAIRLTGMSSGLDTDSMVQELTKAYSTKKDNIVKKKTRLEWTLDAWKETNTKVYDFYTTSLSPMRFSSAYKVKKATSNNETVATVKAANGAPVGTQTLEVRELASSGYATGAAIKGDDGKLAAGTSKLSDYGFSAGRIDVNGKEISFDENTTFNNLVAKLKDAGVDANFDNGRFFISSKESGSESEFTITAIDNNGLDFLSRAGLVSGTDTEGNDTADKLKYEKLASQSVDEIANARYEAAKYTEDSYREYVKGLNSKAVSDRKSTEEQLKNLKKDDFDTEEKYNAKVNELNDKLSSLDIEINRTTEILSDPDKFEAAFNNANSDILAHETEIAQYQHETAVKVVNNNLYNNSSDSARVSGKDARIKLNGVEFTNNTNSFDINGLSISVNEKTKDGESVKITTSNDTQGLYDKIKDFLKSYNEMIGYISKQYYAENAKGYEPLTDDEKENMTDKQIEDWEKKVKDSLLRKDSTLGDLSTSLSNAFLSTTITKDGKKYSLSSFGIGGTSYLSTSDEDRGKFHIDGDKDDKATSSNDDKLMAAISNDPEAVSEFFQELANNIYKTLDNKMKRSSLKSAFTIYNDKEMSSQISDYKKKVSEWEDKIETMQESYYKKFAKMETALSKLQSQTSQLSSMLG